eukprot:TRINITY_DN27269_c0_g1_i1.p1 TRINITY_DN27269_c0_g1~~TRINITY_DN27269_c0_g1_i1.p1  ORF type:complete len:720 (+),score=49.71 TRINITY_DN27269_c0_g1_i1:312-2162(+)
MALGLSPAASFESGVCQQSRCIHNYDEDKNLYIDFAEFLEYVCAEMTCRGRHGEIDIRGTIHGLSIFPSVEPHYPKLTYFSVHEDKPIPKLSLKDAKDILWRSVESVHAMFSKTKKKETSDRKYKAPDNVAPKNFKIVGWKAYDASDNPKQMGKLLAIRKALRHVMDMNTAFTRGLAHVGNYLSKAVWETVFEYNGKKMTIDAPQAKISGIHTPDTHDSSLEKQLGLEKNEWVLLHGTKRAIAESIAKTHFRLSENGMFGIGAYFAESLIKADEYGRRPDVAISGSNDDNKTVYEALPQGEVLITLVVGGNVAETQLPQDNGKKVFQNEVLKGLCNSKLGDRRAYCKTYREFIAVSANQMFVLGHITYEVNACKPDSQYVCVDPALEAELKRKEEAENERIVAQKRAADRAAQAREEALEREAALARRVAEAARPNAAATPAAQDAGGSRQLGRRAPSYSAPGGEPYGADNRGRAQSPAPREQNGRPSGDFTSSAHGRPYQGQERGRRSHSERSMGGSHDSSAEDAVPKGRGKGKRGRSSERLMGGAHDSSAEGAVQKGKGKGKRGRSEQHGRRYEGAPATHNHSSARQHAASRDSSSQRSRSESRAASSGGRSRG